jgi:hypothetical protein
VVSTTQDEDIRVCLIQVIADEGTFGATVQFSSFLVGAGAW